MPVTDTSRSLQSAARTGAVDDVRRLMSECAAGSLGEAPVHVAALNGHTDVVLCLINEFGCDPNVKGWKGRSLLHSTCQGGSISLVQALISNHKADVNAVDEDQVLPMHVAAWKGHSDIVLYLINEFGFDPNQTGGVGRSLLHHACQGGNVSLVRTLIQKYKADVTAIDFKKDPPIHVAAGKGHADVVLCLIDEFQCDPNIKGHKGSTLLHRACHGGNISLVRTLIRGYKADVNAVDVENEAPIHVGAWSGQAEVVSCLINEFSCDPNLRGRNERSLLHEACQSGNISLVRSLVGEHHVDIDVKDVKHRSPLYIAIASNHLAIASCLIKEYDCDCNVSDVDGTVSYAQPLVHLIESRANKGTCNTSLLNLEDRTQEEPVSWDNDSSAHEELCFINKLWDDDGIARAKLGRILLLNACKSNDVELVKALIDQPISPILLTDDKGDTALHIASQLNHSKCVQVLLDANAPILTLNKRKLTPLDVATGEAKQILLEYKDKNGVRQQEQKKCDAYAKHAQQKYSGTYSITRVFVLGEMSAGKSSLIECMKRHFVDSVERVNESSVPPHTAGIIPSVYMDQKYGRLSFYDFAGDSEYYSSHAAIFERLASLSFGHDLFIIVVDLREDDIESILYYWVSFIQHQKFAGIRLSLVVIGSHVDLINDAEIAKKKELFESLLIEFQSDLGTHQVASFMLDCCDPKAYQFSEFNRQILSWKALSPIYPLNADLGLLIGMLERDFSEVTACPMQTIQSHIKTKFSESCLKCDTKSFFPVIYTLHVAGFILILNLHDNPNGEDYYVVLNCSKLTNDVHQSLFSRNAFKKKIKQSQISAFNVGIIPDDIIRDILPPGITEECLVQLQFCQRISSRDVDAFTSIKASTSSEQNFLFFPALCTAEKHSASMPLHPNFLYTISWLAWCKNPRDYFPFRYLHVLLLNLVFKFTLSAPIETCYYGLPEWQRDFQRRCTMWKTGVRWLMTCGVECTVELVQGNRGVVVVSRSREDRSENCMAVFHQVVNCVMELKSKFCHSIKPSFFFLDSVNDVDYLNTDHQFPMSNVERALTCPEKNDNDFIISVSGRKEMERKQLCYIRRFSYWHRVFPIDSFTVCTYLEEVVEELLELGIHLGLSLHVLKTIERDFPKSSMLRKKLVSTWMNTVETPCWWLLIQALETIGYTVMAADIRKKYSVHIELQEKLLDVNNHGLKPDDAFLETFACVLGSAWPSLGCVLPLGENEVEKIMKEVSRLSEVEQALHMLKKWNSEEHATFGELFGGLKTVSLFQYAHRNVGNDKHSPSETPKHSYSKQSASHTDRQDARYLSISSGSSLSSDLISVKPEQNHQAISSPHPSDYPHISSPSPPPASSSLYDMQSDRKPQLNLQAISSSYHYKVPSPPLLSANSPLSSTDRPVCSLSTDVKPLSNPQAISSQVSDYPIPSPPPPPQASSSLCHFSQHNDIGRTLHSEQSQSSSVQSSHSVAKTKLSSTCTSQPSPQSSSKSSTSRKHLLQDGLDPLVKKKTKMFT